MAYDPSRIEKKWQAYWEEHSTFAAAVDPSRPKYYVLDMFPYPSGDGLHVGHPEGYTATDIMARYKRMRGFNVLHPMGWDAFGLPAEQYAIKTGTHPRITTRRNIENFKRQIQSLGFSYDWAREIDTTDPNYVKWTQWIFRKLYERGLAYEAEVPVNWCPELGTVLANEEVIDGKSEVGGHPVVRRPMKQWMLRITEYAERLLADLDTIEWPDSIKEMQRNWIGKRHGSNISFPVDGRDDVLSCFTTRPDTLFGCTFFVISPEHPLVDELTTDEHRDAMESYRDAARAMSDLDRTIESREKTGVFIGSHVINPINQRKVPLYIGDYVLMSYGTGAVMGGPGHDERDFVFAKNYGLGYIPVVCPARAEEEMLRRILEGEYCFTDPGVMLPCPDPVFAELELEGVDNESAKWAITDWLAQRGTGERVVNYRFRDWLFSRQRYWGEPFPIVHWEDGSISLLDESDLPLTLPQVEEYKPSEDGESPLARAGDWLDVVDANGRRGRRETNTMPQWAGSCWYYLRFIDPRNEAAFCDPTLEKAWMPVDLYVGGAEHAVLHLLYARFWHKLLYDLGHVSTSEPFQRLYNQGMLHAPAFRDSRGALVPVDEVTEHEDGTAVRTATGDPLERIIAKMSKSLRNVVTPDEVIEVSLQELGIHNLWLRVLVRVERQ
jgi:leucyl-tRNA synthetase